MAIIYAGYDACRSQQTIIIELLAGGIGIYRRGGKKT